MSWMRPSQLPLTACPRRAPMGVSCCSLFSLISSGEKKVGGAVDDEQPRSLKLAQSESEFSKMSLSGDENFMSSSLVRYKLIVSLLMLQW